MKLKEIAITLYLPNNKGSFTAKAGIYPDEDPKVARVKLKDFVQDSLKVLEE